MSVFNRSNFRVDRGKAPRPRAIRRTRELPLPPPMGHGRAKAERLFNMALHVKSRRDRGMKSGEIVDMLHYRGSCNEDATKKMLERDKRELEELGLIFCYHTVQRYMGEGYTLTCAAPPPIEEVKAARPRGKLKPCDRYVYLMYAAEKSAAMTVERAAKALGVKEEVIIEDLQHMSLCCAGPHPHEYLDARVEEGFIIITGPRLYT